MTGEAGQGERECLTVIVPCLNEEGAIAATIADILAVAPSLPVDVKVWMVDDGSTDGTRREMERLCAAHPDALQMRVNPRNLGLAPSVVETYPLIDARSWVSVIPGDNEFKFSSIRNFLALRERFDIILGYLQNPVIRTFPRRLGSLAFARLANSLYGFSFRYLNGMKLYRVEAFRGIEVYARGPAYSAELLAKAMLRDPELRVGEVPYIARGRSAGQTNIFRPRAIAQAVRELHRGIRAVGAYRRQVIRGAEDREVGSGS